MFDAFANPTLVLLIVALAAAPVTVAIGWRWPGALDGTAIVLTGAAFAAALWGWAGGAEPIDVAWAPEWQLRFHFMLDGVATLYALLATGIGLAVVIYAGRYIPLHLHHQHRPAGDALRFYGFLLLFMGAMVALVMAQDLMLIFLCWDITAIASYFLIGFDRRNDDARYAAMMALLVTGISAIGLLIGTMMLAGKYDTFSLPELIAQAEPSRTVTIAGVLIAVAALAKSAQVPLHFWLPRAMEAPTPVSAYLHSAAMVAAGVFLLSRVHPLLAIGDRVLDGLMAIGLLSMAVGGVLALTRDTLKELLAYSTIAQYGYVVLMLGIGGEDGIAAAMFYVVAHALIKSALFLTAGTVTEVTDKKSLRHLGGLRRQLPLLAIGSGIAAAGLAALPLTIGFFKDELFFEAVDHKSEKLVPLAVIGAGLTVAYMLRFWCGIFLGPQRTEARPAPLRLVAPIAGLSVLTVLGGLWTKPFLRLAEIAAEATAGEPVHIHAAYRFDFTRSYEMAVTAIGFGVGVYLSTRYWQAALDLMSRVGDRFGPERGYRSSLRSLLSLSDRMHRFELHDLRGRIAAVLVPAAVLTVAGIIAPPRGLSVRIGAIGRDDLPLAAIIGVAAVAAVATVLCKTDLTLALTLSGVGFSLAVVYALLSAPDVALVAVLIETLFSLLFFGVLALMPRTGKVRQPANFEKERDRAPWRDPLLAAVAGGLAFVVAWGILSRPASQETVATQQVALTESAHGKDIVTVILADFRGFDTMGEITVIGIAFLGIATLLRRRRNMG
jgi:multicomponent Na+:H+ antiporter subunit A